MHSLVDMKKLRQRNTGYKDNVLFCSSFTNHGQTFEFKNKHLIPYRDGNNLKMTRKPAIGTFFTVKGCSLNPWPAALIPNLASCQFQGSSECRVSLAFRDHLVSLLLSQARMLFVIINPICS